MVAGTQKVLFLCNCCSTTLVPSLNDQSCCSGTTGRTKKAEWRQSVAVVAEWRHSGRHSDRSMDAIGRPKEAHWWYKEGRRVAQIDTQCSHFYWATNGWPLFIHSATTAMCVPSSCLLWATCERPTSSATFLNSATVLNRSQPLRKGGISIRCNWCGTVRYIHFVTNPFL